MKHASVAAKVADRKKKYPEQYCKRPKCLWRTDNLYCPRHEYPKLEAKAK